MQEEIPAGEFVEVVDLAQDKIEVASPGCGKGGGGQLGAGFQVGEHPERAPGTDQQHHHEGRQQALQAPGIKARKDDAARLMPFLGQQAGDQIAGEDEKYIDAHKSAAEEGHIGVAKYHQEDGDRAQALKVWPEGHGI